MIRTVPIGHIGRALGAEFVKDLGGADELQKFFAHAVHVDGERRTTIDDDSQTHFFLEHN